MTLRIIGAGFGRTGTYSLKLALEQLGFGPCHHMYEVRRRPEQIRHWSAIADGRKPRWDEVFAGFQSQVDWPAAFYWKELVDAYPNSRAILTVRDPEAWYRSVSQTILPASTIGRTDDPDPSGRAGSEIIYKIVLQSLFDGRLEDKEHALAAFAKHRQEVLEHIPPERLLVFDVREGWDALCDFLRVEKPQTPFPNGNSTQEYRARKTYL